jgi:hypothetical protein
VDVCHPLGKGCIFVKGEMVGNSDNVLQENVAGVHETKSIKVMKSYSLLFIRTEVTDRSDVPVWFHHKSFLFESLLVGNCHCASERSIIVEAYEEFWMDSRSNDGWPFLGYITT